jgi:hypothetical protein
MWVDKSIMLFINLQRPGRLAYYVMTKNGHSVYQVQQNIGEPKLANEWIWNELRDGTLIEL